MKHQTLQILSFISALIAIIAILQMENAQQANQALLESVELLKASFEAEREENLLELERLQREICLQQEINYQLKLELRDLEEEKTIVDSQAHEKKTAIVRITAVDSLRNEISRHYYRP